MGTHLVGVVVGSGNLDGGGEVEDDGALALLVLAGEPGLLDGVAELDGELGLGLGEGLGRVLELPLSAITASDGLVNELANKLDVLDGEGDGLLLGVLEDLLTEHGGRGIVHVEDDILGVAHRLDGAADELLTSGREDLRRRSSDAKKGGGVS